MKGLHGQATHKVYQVGSNQELKNMTTLDHYINK